MIGQFKQCEPRFRLLDDFPTRFHCSLTSFLDFPIDHFVIDSRGQWGCDSIDSGHPWRNFRWPNQHANGNQTGKIASIHLCCVTGTFSIRTNFVAKESPTIAFTAANRAARTTCPTAKTGASNCRARSPRLAPNQCRKCRRIRASTYAPPSRTCAASSPDSTAAAESSTTKCQWPSSIPTRSTATTPALHSISQLSTTTEFIYLL